MTNACQRDFALKATSRPLLHNLDPEKRNRFSKKITDNKGLKSWSQIPLPSEGGRRIQGPVKAKLAIATPSKAETIPARNHCSVRR